MNKYSFILLGVVIMVMACSTQAPAPSPVTTNPPPSPTTDISAAVAVEEETPLASAPTPLPRPTDTPIPTATPVPSTPTPAATSTPQPTPTPVPTETPTPTSTPEPTSTPHPTPTPLPTPTVEERTHTLAELLLKHTNAARTSAGLPPVVMGRNRASQIHAEESLEDCVSSHWDQWGLKPNHRYTLSGGTGTGRENVLGLNYCIDADDNYAPIGDLDDEILQAHQIWMDSPGHRANILDPAHRTMNVGIAWDAYNATIVQQFSSGYVIFTGRPSIAQNGIISFGGRVRNAALGGAGASFVLNYHEPPKLLTRGQRAHTYGLCRDKTVTVFAQPLPTGGSKKRGYDLLYYESLDGSYEHSQRCIDPYQTNPDKQAPTDATSARTALESAKLATPTPPETVKFKYTVAQKWVFTANQFEVRADISKILEQNGPGIYTLFIWGYPKHMKGPAVLSEQAIFWQTSPPEGSPYRP